MMLRKIALALAVLLLPAVASAQATQVRVRLETPTGSPYLLNNVAANASAATRTITVAVGGYSRLTWQVNLTRVAATAITMTCQGSTDKGVTFANISSMAVSGGVGALTPFTWSYAVSATDGTVIDISLGSYDSVACIFAAPGGGASDLLKVSGIKGAL